MLWDLCLLRHLTILIIPIKNVCLRAKAHSIVRHMQMIMLVSLKFSYWNKNVKRESNIGLKSYMTSIIN